MITVYTDGACSGNGTDRAIGGIGVHFPNGEYSDISQKVCSPTTNNHCELLAIKVALEITKGKEKIIYSDSSYSVNSLTKWVNKWIKDGSINTRPNNKLIIEIVELMKDGKTELIHIKRSTHQGNITADFLATSGKLAQ